mmetsp:Transcript_20644/g.58074  ORF Transcript_20644/g.58074 Transcript_20644/m.58074 type:complete len:420 (+) Transcript_20644:451-1710(+)
MWPLVSSVRKSPSHILLPWPCGAPHEAEGLDGVSPELDVRCSSSSWSWISLRDTEPLARGTVQRFGAPAGVEGLGRWASSPPLRNMLRPPFRGLEGFWAVTRVLGAPCRGWKPGVALFGLAAGGVEISPREGNAEVESREGKVQLYFVMSKDAFLLLSPPLHGVGSGSGSGTRSLLSGVRLLVCAADVEGEAEVAEAGVQDAEASAGKLCSAAQSWAASFFRLLCFLRLFPLLFPCSGAAEACDAAAATLSQLPLTGASNVFDLLRTSSKGGLLEGGAPACPWEISSRASEEEIRSPSSFVRASSRRGLRLSFARCWGSRASLPCCAARSSRSSTCCNFFRRPRRTRAVSAAATALRPPSIKEPSSLSSATWRLERRLCGREGGSSAFLSPVASHDVSRWNSASPPAPRPLPPSPSLRS